MSYIDHCFLNNEETKKRASQINWEIADLLRQKERNLSKAFPLIPYLLHKASTYNDPLTVTFEMITNGEMDLKEDVRFLAEEVLTEELWKESIPLVTEYSSDDFAVAALISVTENDQKSMMNTPRSILQLANALLNVQAGDQVADVCSGNGNYMISAALKEENASYHGFEINVVAKAATLMQADLLGIDLDVTICDVFNLPDSSTQKFDKIFSEYPLGVKLRNLGAGSEYLNSLSNRITGLSKMTSSDWVFNSLLCDLLKENGKAVGIMASGSAWNKMDMSMRQYFVENRLVECVISLPNKMFPYMSMPASLIVLSHNNDGVRMIDASNIYQPGRRHNEFSNSDIETIIDALTKDQANSRHITIEELRENEYNLSLNRYLHEEVSFTNGVKFGDIIKSISRGAPCKASQLDKMVSNEVTDMQYLMLSNIQDGIIDDKLPYLSEIDKKYEKYCLKNNALLLSKNGFPYKVAVASVKDGKRILVNGNLYIIELDEEKANPYYIKAFFDSELGYAALKNISAGVAVPNISVENLSNMQIPLPPMEVQNKVAMKYQATLDEISVMKLRLEKAVNKLHYIYDEESC